MSYKFLGQMGLNEDYPDATMSKWTAWIYNIKI